MNATVEGKPDIDPTQEKERRTHPAESVAKALRLLDCFVGAGPEVGLSDLARQARLSKSTTFRLLGQLVESGYVDRIGNRYGLSLRAFELGSHYMHDGGRGLRSAAAPHLASLFQYDFLIVNLAMLNGTDVIYLDKIQGPRAPFAPSEVGGRVPAAVTALGKAILAFSPRPTVEAALAHNAECSRRPVAPGLFLRELSRVRGGQVAYEREESAPGITCVASPIMVGRRPIGSVSVSGPVGRFRPERMAAAVHQAAGRTSAEHQRLLYADRL